MSYLRTKCEVKPWTNKTTVVISMPLPVMWLIVLGSLRPGVLLASDSSVQIGLNFKRISELFSFLLSKSDHQIA